ncbi:MAG: aminotransferase class I/II-fold pyridoxal phosphate-dependent enzyme [Clostridia bacterium]|nr:aminotransferase class I/II-fold pyridoxal phosphate-dependent enzyme [Clostridia bacterium]
MLDYEKIINPVVAKMPPSGIRKFFDLLDTMDDVVGLTVGQPDFVTPWHIREEGIESISTGKTYYTSNAGLLALRREITSYLQRRFSLNYSPEKETVVTVGGSEAIDMAMRAVLAPGDEVIIPEPCFVCYAPLASLCGAVPKPVVTRNEDQFKLKAEDLEKALTPRTKLVVLPYPNNPTGAVMTREDLIPIADLLRDKQIVVLSDEIYCEMTYGFLHTSIASLPGMRERTIIASGFSKAFAMTGWRLGYLCAPEPLAKAILKLHQYAIMCASTASQFAGIEALKNGEEDVRNMVSEYDRRRRYIYNGLHSIGLEAFEPEGAFYIYPDIRPFGLSSAEFCERLLYEYKCAIVPGPAFGACGEGFARISYAYSVKHITEALSRIEAFVKHLRA